MRVHVTIAYELSRKQYDHVVSGIEPSAAQMMNAADVAAHDLLEVLGHGSLTPDYLHLTTDNGASVTHGYKSLQGDADALDAQRANQLARISNDLDALSLLASIDDDEQRRHAYGTEWPRLARLVIKRLRLELGIEVDPFS